MAERWPQAVVFDLDGTLIDTLGDIADVLNAVLVDAGLGAIPESQVRTLIGGGVRKLIERALAKLQQPDDPRLVDRLTAEFTERYRRLGAGRSAVYPGGRELLENLTRAGIHLGICTNKPAPVTARVLASFDLLPFFGAVVGETEQWPRKPHPAMLLAAMDALGAERSDTVMVGDSAFDVETARAAGTPVVLVSYGYSSEPARALGADAVIDHLGELTAILPQLQPAAASRSAGP